MAPVTADICDLQATALASGCLRILSAPWRHYGAKSSFAGAITTLAANGCNSLIREILAEPGASRVLIISAGNHPEALIGDNLAQMASRNGWAGIIVHGNVRDTQELKLASIGIAAIGTWPERSRNDRGGTRDLPLLVNDCVINPGEWVYVDLDGVLISQSQLLTQSP